MQLSDRIIVLHAGQVMGEVLRDEAEVAEIGLLMSGVYAEVAG